MSRILNRMFGGLMLVIVVVLVFTGLRDSLQADGSLGRSFALLMGELPFASRITGLLAVWMGFTDGIPPMNTRSLFEELVRLLLMAAIQGPITAFLTRLFLPIPQNLPPAPTRWEAEERYMASPGYRIKSLLVAVVSAPVVALLCGQLIKLGVGKLQNSLGTVGTILMDILLTVVIFMLSVVWLLKRSFSLATAVRWRLGSTVLVGMVKTVGVNTLCLLLYLSLLKQWAPGVLASLVGLVVWLIILEAGGRLLLSTLVGEPGR